MHLLRKSILQINLKIHSVFADFFSDTTIKADIDSYLEIQRYLATMQPKFIEYVRKQKEQGLEEGFVYLDSNLKEVGGDALYVTRLKDGDTIHIVPAVIGGGGKRGFLLAAAAVAAFFVIGPAAVALTGTAAGTAGGAAAAAGGLGVKASLAAIKASSFLSTIVGNVGLALLSALFNRPPDQDSSATRENTMFSSLKNTTDSGTSVPMHYGLVRVSGQFISGYVKTIAHGRGEIISVETVVSGETDPGGAV